MTREYILLKMVQPPYHNLTTLSPVRILVMSKINLIFSYSMKNIKIIQICQQLFRLIKSIFKLNNCYQEQNVSSRNRTCVLSNYMPLFYQCANVIYILYIDEICNSYSQNLRTLKILFCVWGKGRGGRLLIFNRIHMIVICIII